MLNARCKIVHCNLGALTATVYLDGEPITQAVLDTFSNTEAAEEMEKHLQSRL